MKGYEILIKGGKGRPRYESQSYFKRTTKEVVELIKYLLVGHLLNDETIEIRRKIDE